MKSLRYKPGVEEKIMSEIQKFFEYGAKLQGQATLENVIQKVFTEYSLGKRLLADA
jgi:hypothetical protein